MKRLLMLALLLLTGAAQAKTKVVATLSDLGAIAREVGGDQVDVEVLARPTQDPHFVDAKPSLVLHLARADLLLLNGMELEVGWLPALLTASRNGELQVGGRGYLDCSTFVTPKEVPLQKLDRSMGDIHPGGNPHYTKDPRNGILVAMGIAERLGQLDPAHAGDFEANAKKFQANLQAKIAGWQKQLAPYQGTPIITFHKSWIYFADWAGLTEVGFIEPKPGIPPNPTHVVNVLQVIKARHVPVILQEDWYSANVGIELARISGATLVKVPGMTADGKSYADEVGTVVDETVKALAAHRS